MDESTDTERCLVAYSKVLGYLPCEVVGCNQSQYLLRIYGQDIPTPKELVFELRPGWKLHKGCIVPSGREASDTCVTTRSVVTIRKQVSPEGPYSTNVTTPKLLGSHVGQRPSPQFIWAFGPRPSLSLSWIERPIFVPSPASMPSSVKGIRSS